MVGELDSQIRHARKHSMSETSMGSEVISDWGDPVDNQNPRPGTQAGSRGRSRCLARNERVGSRGSGWAAEGDKLIFVRVQREAAGQRVSMIFSQK